MVEGQHLDGQVVVLSVEVKSSVIKGVRIILLDRELASTSEELDNPVVACAVSVLLEYLRLAELPRAADAVLEGELCVGNEPSVRVTHADGVSGDFLEACGAEVEADVGTGGEDVAWGALLAMHALFVGVLAFATVVGAVPAALLCQVVPLVLATGARIARFAVGFVVALCEVVIANLIDTGFTCAW